MKNILIIMLLLISLSKGWSQSSQIIVHDPVAIEADGKYYMFSTGVGIAGWVSDDMINWRFLTQVFNPIPEWAKKAVPKFDGNMWAPDISYHNGKYYLYYSISSFASNLSSIGVATNESLDPEHPDYQWIDHGPVVSSVPGRDMWNAIDPNLIFDENKVPWMTFGSFWNGLKLVKLNADLLSVAEPQQWKTIAARERDFQLPDEDPGNAAIEAPFIFQRGDDYYLFVSFDLCCRGARSTYNVRVGRSKSATGPFLDKDGIDLAKGGGTLVVQGDENYYGIGHNSVYTFGDKIVMYSHGYDKHDKGKPKLMVHFLEFDAEGWPVVKEWK